MTRPGIPNNPIPSARNEWNPYHEEIQFPPPNNPPVIYYRFSKYPIHLFFINCPINVFKTKFYFAYIEWIEWFH